MPKIVFVGRMGWLVANTKTKWKTTLKGPKTSKMKISKNGKSTFPTVPQNTFSKGKE